MQGSRGGGLALGSGFLLTALSGAVALSGAAASVTASAESASVSAGLLVRFDPGIAADARKAVADRAGVTLGERVRGTDYVFVATGSEDSKSVKVLEADSRVADVELNHVRRAFNLPNDPVYPRQQRYMERLRLPQAWSASTSVPAVRVAVVDTGVEAAEPDLAGRVLAGHDFVNDDSDAHDDHWHGTSLAQIIAANTNDGIGIAGASPSARILPVKVLDNYARGTDADIAAGITWAADQGADVINLSLGGPEESAVLRQAVEYALSRDVVVVAAAGNEGTAVPQYPAAYPGVIAVGATDSNGDFAYLSSHGSWVDVAAPGLFIITAIGSYHQGMSGTSYAAAFASGVASLTQARYATLTAPEVRSRLLEMAQDAGPLGIDLYYGHGFLDAFAAVGGAKQPPATPPQDASEPNDVRSAATAIDAAHEATLSPEGDVDWYSIDVSSPGLVAFTVFAPGWDTTFGPQTDPRLSIYDSNGVELDERQIGGWGQRESIAAEATAGRYFLRVENAVPTRGARPYWIYPALLPSYSVTWLEVPPETYGFEVNDVNDAGVAVGAIYTRPSPTSETVVRAARWENGRLEYIGDSSVRFAKAISDQGQIVGHARCGGPLQPCGFVAHGSDVTFLHDFPGPEGVNGRGQIAGHFIKNWRATPAVWEPGRRTELGGLWSTTTGSATDINELGQVVGNVGEFAFLWQEGRLTELGALGGCGIWPEAISDVGLVVGVALEVGCGAPRAFLTDGDYVRDLDFLPGALTSEAHDVNAAGQIVGESSWWGGYDVPFLYQNGVMVDLNDLIPPTPGWTLSSAAAINDVGQIVGTAFGETNNSFGDPVRRGFLLTPSKPPSAPSPHPPPHPPAVHEIWAERVSQEGVTLKGTITPRGDLTTYRFDYWVDTPDTGRSETLEVPVRSSGKVTVGTSLVLHPGTHYARLVARNPAGASVSATISFTIEGGDQPPSPPPPTPPPPPPSPPPTPPSPPPTPSPSPSPPPPSPAPPEPPPAPPATPATPPPPPPPASLPPPPAPAATPSPPPTPPAETSSAAPPPPATTPATADKRPPNTLIARPLRVHTRGRRVTVAFASTERGSRFQCKLDRRAWTTCRSPKAYKGLAVGWHTFRVRARDTSGNVDPTPAVRRWRIWARGQVFRRNT